MKCKLWTERLAKKGAVETGVKRDLKKVHKPWIGGKNSAQTVNEGGAKPWSANRELGAFKIPDSSVSVHNVHFIVYAPLNLTVATDADADMMPTSIWGPKAHYLVSSDFYPLLRCLLLSFFCSPSLCLSKVVPRASVKILSSIKLWHEIPYCPLYENYVHPTTEKAHHIFQHKLVTPPPQTPTFGVPEKVYVPRFLGRGANKRPTSIFLGGGMVGPQKWPQIGILGHNTFSLPFIGNKSVTVHGQLFLDYSYSSGRSDKVIHVRVTAPGGCTRELIHRHRLQLQFLILTELINTWYCTLPTWIIPYVSVWFWRIFFKYMHVINDVQFKFSELKRLLCWAILLTVEIGGANAQLHYAKLCQNMFWEF